jgi:hypothetical protein
MKKLLVPLLCIAIPIATSAADGGYKIAYDGGSVTDVKVGTRLKLYVDSNKIQLVSDRTLATIPPSAVTEISYGENVHRRVGTAIAVGYFTLGLGGLIALTKSKKHFVGLTWINGDQKGGLVMQCDKNDYRGVLTGLEGVTGKKAVDSANLTDKN